VVAIAIAPIDAAAQKRLYAPPRTPVMVDVPRMRFLMIDGQGSPDSPGFQVAISALYTLSHHAKFALKKEGGPDYHVGPMEGLWWGEDMQAFETVRKDDWLWTLMIAQPEAVTPEWLSNLREQAARKKKLPALEQLRLQELDEGQCAQVMHVGPYCAEGPTIAALHDFIREQGYHFDGRVQKHHEIYLGDPRRTKPERLRTILRQPVAAI
jgi:hypothetical protein